MADQAEVLSSWHVSTIGCLHSILIARLDCPTLSDKLCCNLDFFITREILY